MNITCLLDATNDPVISSPTNCSYEQASSLREKVCTWSCSSSVGLQHSTCPAPVLFSATPFPCPALIQSGSCGNPAISDLGVGLITLGGFDTCSSPDTFGGSAIRHLAGPEYVFLIPGQALERNITVTTVATPTGAQFE